MLAILKGVAGIGITDLVTLRAGLPADRAERGSNINEFLESLSEVSAVQGRQVLVEVIDWAFGLQPQSFSFALASGVYSVKKRVFSGHWVEDFSAATSTTGSTPSSSVAARAAGVAAAGSSFGSLLCLRSIGSSGLVVVPPLEGAETWKLNPG